MKRIGDELQSNQIANLASRGYHTKQDIREASDDDLLDVPGIGPATLESLRELVKLPPKKGKQGIAKRFLVLRHNETGKPLGFSPGDVIPEEYDPETQVKQGKAKWR